MVAIIKVGSSINRMLNYNENKVTQQKAICLYAGNYPVDANRLNFTMKQGYLLRQMQLNTNVSRNSLHISLNFDPSEKDLGNDKMTEIAGAYMQEIGFGEQPYLVYRHFDAGHPHLHLVTTNIRQDGSRIDLHHLAIRKSEPARKKLEEAFGLIRAQGRRAIIEKAGTRPAEYGKSETRNAIQNVLDAVLSKYKYTSLAGLNAVLGIYNIRADSGAEGSRVNRHHGLLYHIVDDKGEAVGVPVKASLFHTRPTLARLEVKFAKNAITLGQHKARVKNTIDRLRTDGKPLRFEEMVSGLAAQGITLVKRQSDEGRLYGITYIDHQSGAVLNGSDLGKAYSAKEMLNRFPDVPPSNPLRVREQGKVREKLDAIATGVSTGNTGAAQLIQQISSILDTLTREEFGGDYIPKNLTRKKRRKRRGQQGNS
ncbi:relaxase/mobilization nuclease domain-containing protein [Flavobacterium sp. RHBU_24]|uniref:relaxase/mobilization nuclease domain-containing protein n=1 Tax=Flavobacterium sp. RHBU_24 TaxID=3391185 RepID=UPI003984F45D